VLRSSRRRHGAAARAAVAATATAWLPAALAISPPATAPESSAPPACAGQVYLTLDTGTMRHAELIAGILKRRHVPATFFLANEQTADGGTALGPEWAAFWQARVKEGHAFGSHTFDHVYFSAAPAAGPRSPAMRVATPVVRARPQFGASAGRALDWDEKAVCTEIDRVDERFRQITGRPLDRIWRAPGGRGPQAVFDMARSCGWRHVGWAPAGFLGDELPSETHPNDRLLARSLAGIRSGDILMAHLGIRSRHDPYAPTLDALIAGLQARKLCFSTIPRHPSFASPS
jgi:peptidoglycan/xylan/chitin deacetylase (PgdA/CDA1 family)